MKGVQILLELKDLDLISKQNAGYSIFTLMSNKIGFTVLFLHLLKANILDKELYNV